VLLLLLLPIPYCYGRWQQVQEHHRGPMNVGQVVFTSIAKTWFYGAWAGYMPDAFWREIVSEPTLSTGQQF
jgi:hypothetical protein